MNCQTLGAIALALPLVLAGQAWAQEAVGAPTPVAASLEPPVAAPVTVPGVRIPAGTLVDLEILSAVGSETAKLGDKVAIRLVNPLVIDGVTVIPAGAEGVAEVTSVKPAGMMSNGGELMILARYLTVGDQQVPLRGLKLGIRGDNNLFAAFVFAQAVGPFALFVKGGNVIFPAGTQAQAKIATETILAPTAAPAAAPAN